MPRKKEEERNSENCPGHDNPGQYPPNSSHDRRLRQQRSLRGYYQYSLPESSRSPATAIGCSAAKQPPS